MAKKNSATDAKELILESPIWGLPDFTTYVDHEHFIRFVGKFETRFQRTGIQQSVLKSKRMDESITLGDSSRIDCPPVKGRVLACPCFDNRYYSISVRPDSELEFTSPTYWPDEDWSKSTKGWWSEDIEAITAGNLIFHNTMADCADVKGLLLVAGQTQSGKSFIARELLARYLVKRRNSAKTLSDRRPHLITIEDPIEKPLYDPSDNADPVSHARECGIDYTPRHLGVDVNCIADALRDALRQKPTAVFVGEVRSEDDWKSILQFAGTGHLIVATCHAGSVVETVANLLSISQAKSVEEQAFVVERLLGIVHLKPYRVGEEKIVRIPALWRSTNAGKALFAMDRLTSFLPHFPPDYEVRSLQLPANVSSVGRQWFADRMCPTNVDKKQWECLVEACVAHDLKGL